MPWDLEKFWIVHASKDITDRYSQGFQNYLDAMRYPYEFEKEWPGKKKRPDYTVTRNGVFLFDVKDFEPHMPLGFNAYDPYPRIRQKIEEGREKFSNEQIAPEH